MIIKKGSTVDNQIIKMSQAAILFNIQRQQYWQYHYQQQNNPAAAKRAEEIINRLKKYSTVKGAAQ